jgi:hypothetical protein
MADTHIELPSRQKTEVQHVSRHAHVSSGFFLLSPLEVPRVGPPDKVRQGGSSLSVITGGDPVCLLSFPPVIMTPPCMLALPMGLKPMYAFDRLLSTTGRWATMLLNQVGTCSSITQRQAFAIAHQERNSVFRTITKSRYSPLQALSAVSSAATSTPHPHSLPPPPGQSVIFAPCPLSRRVSSARHHVRAVSSGDDNSSSMPAPTGGSSAAAVADIDPLDALYDAPAPAATSHLDNPAAESSSGKENVAGRGATGEQQKGEKRERGASQSGSAEGKGAGREGSGREGGRRSNKGQPPRRREELEIRIPRPTGLAGQPSLVTKDSLTDLAGEDGCLKIRKANS